MKILTFEEEKRMDFYTKMRERSISSHLMISSDDTQGASAS